jgi:hemerythrin-like domain-containing protein
MIEHRLIERMIALIDHKLGDIERTGQADPLFIDTIVDFVRTYADRTHHGKEEDILFVVLAQKSLAAGDQQVMQELIQEHLIGRRTTRELVAANDRYRSGDVSALATISEKLAALAAFYPPHIAKEDKVFFPAYMSYLSAEEDQALLQRFWEFDRGMIHEKYRAIVQALQP